MTTRILVEDTPQPLEVFRKAAVFRPSTRAGKMYPELSRAYFEAVHAVLSGKEFSSNAASDLEEELRQILKTTASIANPEVRSTLSSFASKERLAASGLWGSFAVAQER